jgi:hypothetical protein
MSLPALAVFLALPGLLQEEAGFSPAGSFRPDRGPQDKVYALYSPREAEPEAMRDHVLFLRDRSLECVRLPKGDPAWTLELPYGPVREPLYFRAAYADGRLHLWNDSRLERRAVDLRTGRAEAVPDPEWTAAPASGDRILLSKDDREGLHFRLRGSDWRWSLPHEKGRHQWHRQDGPWIVVQRRGEEEKDPELLIRRAGEDAPARVVPLPGPAGYGMALAQGCVYLSGEHSRFARNRFESEPLDPPPPFIWAHLAIDLETARVVQEERIPYTEDLRRQARLTGAYGPVAARRARGIDGLGLLVEEPSGLALERERTLWRRPLEKPHVVYSDADLILARTAAELLCLLPSTGEILSRTPLAARAGQSWDREGDVLVAHGWDETDTAAGVYSVRSGVRLLPFRPRPRQPSRTGAVAINWPYYWNRIATAGGKAAVDARLESGDAPAEVRILDLKTGRRLDAVPVDERVDGLILKERWLLVQTPGGVRVFAR